MIKKMLEIFLFFWGVFRHSLRKNFLKLFTFETFKLKVTVFSVRFAFHRLVDGVYRFKSHGFRAKYVEYSGICSYSSGSFSQLCSSLELREMLEPVYQHPVLTKRCARCKRLHLLEIRTPCEQRSRRVWPLRTDRLFE